MSHRKCLICRHHKAGHCLRLDKPCAKVQDDSLCDPCGVSQEEGANWELPRKHEKKRCRNNDDVPVYWQMDEPSDPRGCG